MIIIRVTDDMGGYDGGEFDVAYHLASSTQTAQRWLKKDVKERESFPHPRRNYHLFDIEVDGDANLNENSVHYEVVDGKLVRLPDGQG